MSHVGKSNSGYSLDFILFMVFLLIVFALVNTMVYKKKVARDKAYESIGIK